MNEYYHEYYKAEIERIKNSIDSVQSQPKPVEEDHLSMSAILDCAYKQMYSFSLIKTIYNVLTKKKVAKQAPCKAFANWMNQIEHAVGVK